MWSRDLGDRSVDVNELEKKRGGPHSTMDGVLAMHSAALGSILAISKKISLDVA